MRCTYCDIPISALAYACQCNPNVCLCIRCEKFGNCTCGKKFKEIKVMLCDCCYKSVASNKILYENQTKYDKKGYCAKCCIKLYELSDPRFMNYFGCTPGKKADIQKFIRLFCYKCFNIITKQVNIDIKQNLKENLCDQCIKQSLPIKQKSTQIKQEIKLKQQKIQVNLSEKQEFANVEDKKPKKSRAQLYDYWLRAQKQHVFPKCMSCQGAVFNRQNITINEQVIFCERCTVFTMRTHSECEKNIQDELKNKQNVKQSQIINKNLPNRGEVKNNKQRKKQDANIAEKPYLMESILQSVQAKMMQPNQLVQHQKIIQIPNITQKLPVKQIQQIQSTEFDKTEIIKKPILITTYKQLGSESIPETELLRLKIQIQWRNDEDMIECSSCKTQIEAAASIWEQQNNNPICRCCFSDIIENAKEVQMRRNNHKYRRYTSKQVQQNVSTRQNDIPTIAQTEKKKQIRQNSQALSKTTAPKSKPFFEEKQSTSKQKMTKDPDLNIQIEDLEGADIILSDNGPKNDKLKYNQNKQFVKQQKKNTNQRTINKKQFNNKSKQRSIDETVINLKKTNDQGVYKNQKIQKQQKAEKDMKDKNGQIKSINQINLPVYKKPSTNEPKQIVFETHPQKDNQQIVKKYRQQNRRGVMSQTAAPITRQSHPMYPPTHANYLLNNKIISNQLKLSFDCAICRKFINRQPKYIIGNGQPICLQCRGNITQQTGRRI